MHDCMQINDPLYFVDRYDEYRLTRIFLYYVFNCGRRLILDFTFWFGVRDIRPDAEKSK